MLDILKGPLSKVKFHPSWLCSALSRPNAHIAIGNTSSMRLRYCTIKHIHMQSSMTSVFRANPSKHICFAATCMAGYVDRPGQDSHKCLFYWARAYYGFGESIEHVFAINSAIAFETVSISKTFDVGTSLNPMLTSACIKPYLNICPALKTISSSQVQSREEDKDYICPVTTPRWDETRDAGNNLQAPP